MAVSVNYVNPMSPGNTPTPPPSPSEEEERRRRVENIVKGTGTNALQNPFNFGGWMDWAGQNFQRNMPQTPVNPEDLIKGKAGSGKQMGPAAPSMTSEEHYAQLLNMLGLTGGGGGRPDFSGYRNALIGQADELNARIQAMYNQLAAQAGENMGRVQEIYGGAQEGVGSIYDSAAGNIQQAYGSAQEQAADQMARLGIEAAAPAVIDPMALSQAEAVSGLETGRAGGLSALGRYGSTAQDFGSQMAQVAQQQGTEMNSAILASLQNRLADSLAAEQAGGGGGGGGGMSVSDQLKLMQFADQKYRQDILGEMPLDERKFGFQQAESFAEPINRQFEQIVNDYMALSFPKGKTPDPIAYFGTLEAARQEARRILGLQ